jgi:hypothetical protein
MGCGVGGESASHSEVQPRAGKSLKSVSESLNPWSTPQTRFSALLLRCHESASRASLGRWVAGGSGVLGLPQARGRAGAMPHGRGDGRIECGK